jgi:hypothetical protein
MINKMMLEPDILYNAHDSYQTPKVHISWYSAAEKNAFENAK